MKNMAPTSLIKSSLMSFKSRLLAVYQSVETFYLWWEDFLLAGTLEESCVVQWLRFLFAYPVPETHTSPTLAFPKTIWTFLNE